MKYWHGLFTPFTWEAFLKGKEKALGYREARRPTVMEKIQKGDRILAYVAGPACWVGVLEVTGSGYEDKRTRIHGQMGFPCRVPVKVVAAVHTQQGPARDGVLKKLSRKAKSTWRGWIQGSPRACFSEQDGKAIEAAIKEAKKSGSSRDIPERLMNWRYMHPERRERELAQAKKASKAKKAGRPKAKKKTAKPRITRSKRASSALTAAENQKILAALSKGHGGAFPADATAKALAWGQSEKKKQSANFGFVIDGVVGLKFEKGKVFVSA